MQSEITLATLPSDNQDERLQVLLTYEGGRSVVSLVQQSWAEGVGWYTQNALELSPHQVRQLRSALGGPAALPAERIVPLADPIVSVAFPAAARAESA